MNHRALLALLELLLLGAVLSAVARVWFARWLIGGLLALSGRFFTPVYQCVRTPGNVVHECSHALGFLLAGYSVRRVCFWFTDPQGRGFAESGGPWAPWASPFLVRLVASPAPLLGGALLLQAAAHALGLPAVHGELLVASRNGLPGLEPFLAQAQEVMHWATTPRGTSGAIVFPLLTLSLALDLAPSLEDLIHLSRSLLSLLLLLLGATVLADQETPIQSIWPQVDSFLASILAWLSQPLWWTLVTLVLVGSVLSIVRLVLVGVR